MNSNFPIFRSAEPMSFAFLATRASNALERVIEDKPIGADEKDVLDQAVQFLREISNGAQISTHGTFAEGLSPSRSLAALDIAFGPIDALRRLVSNEKDVALIFEKLSNAVEHVRETGKTEGNVTLMQGVKQFFDALSAFVLNDLATRNPLVGTSAREVA